MTENEARRDGVEQALDGMATRFEHPARATTVFFGWEVAEHIRRVWDEIKDHI